MDPYVTAGSAAALGIIAGATVVSWKRARQHARLRASDVGPALLVVVGANTITTAAKVGDLLVRDRIKIAGDVRCAFAALSGDELIFLVGGLVAALIIGVVTIQDGWNGLIARESEQR